MSADSAESCRRVKVICCALQLGTPVEKVRCRNRGSWLEEIMQSFYNNVFCLVLSGQKGSIPLGSSGGGLSIECL